MSSKASRRPATSAPRPAAAGASARATGAAGPGNAARAQSVAARAAEPPSFAERVRGAVDTGGKLLQRITGQSGGDIRREGTLTDPRSRGAVPLDRAFTEAKAQGQGFGEWLMERYAFQPKGERTTPADDRTLRVFLPGLNTPEPEASRRTANYADTLGQPMVHLHNGTNADAGFDGAEGIDYGTALAARGGLVSTPLLQSLVTLLRAALTGAEPQDVHAILYSDSTIAGSRAIAIVRGQMIDARVRAGKGKKDAQAEVDALLEKHLFVEMHGNVAADLPKGPRYVLWADEKDTITHNRPHPSLPPMGFSGRHRDADADALHVDYDGPFGGADAHNLEAVGVHAVRQTWAANGVRSSQELHDKHRRDERIDVPDTIRGDARRLWNPRNDPNWGTKKR
jgi:hypothetical protein